MDKEKFMETLNNHMRRYTAFEIVNPKLDKDNDPLIVVIKDSTKEILAYFYFAGNMVYGLHAEGSIEDLHHLLSLVTLILEGE